MKKHADGRYCKKVTLPDGTKKYIYGVSPAEVNQKAREALNAADVGVRLDDNTTVGEWAVEWFATYKQGLRANTLMGYRNAYNTHIYPYLQSLELKQVRPIHIQKVMNYVSDKSESLQNKVLLTLRQLFKTALQNGLIPRDPTEGIKITCHADETHTEALSPQQQEYLLKAVTDPRAKLFCALGLYCVETRRNFRTDVVGYQR